ncbi:hypothetical protein BDV95DRAFT_595987 [Massariosphaeria phaeospora]|uniref:Uncharacterized protein n=1 Tax=Massariosphaeria phaeospora TaxID=100035 RepID=A0A7C8I6S4_9PLEO|nr:hypothetical protein BDV95DRAFT_595987 [Massariosphaeria phaeospora]
MPTYIAAQSARFVERSWWIRWLPRLDELSGGLAGGPASPAWGCRFARPCHHRAKGWWMFEESGTTQRTGRRGSSNMALGPRAAGRASATQAASGMWHPRLLDSCSPHPSLPALNAIDCDAISALSLVASPTYCRAPAGRTGDTSSCKCPIHAAPVSQVTVKGRRMPPTIKPHASAARPRLSPCQKRHGGNPKALRTTASSSQCFPNRLSGPANSANWRRRHPESSLASGPRIIASAPRSQRPVKDKKQSL